MSTVVHSTTPALEFVDPTKNMAGLNFLLYGPPGTGKTTLASSGPGPVLLVNAEGPNALQHARRTYGNDKLREVAFKGDATLKALMQFIREHEDAIGTVVLDSVGEIHKALLNELIDASGKESATLPQYGVVNSRIERFSRWMLTRKPVFVLVCHEQTDTDAMTGNMVRMPLTGGKQLPPILAAMVDVVGYTGVSVKEGVSTYYTNFISDGTKYGKDRTNKLGVNRRSDITRWLEAVNSNEGSA